MSNTIVSHCGRPMTQVAEYYVFTVADSSAIDSFEIVVDAEGHNALSDFNGPAKVKSLDEAFINVEDTKTRELSISYHIV